MSNKTKIITVSAIVLLAIAASTTLFFINRNKNIKERAETFELIENYASNNEYTKALELLNGLLDSRADDAEAIKLIAALTKQKEEFERAEKLKAELVDSIKKESEAIFKDNILEEFTKLKNELIKLDPGNLALKEILENIDTKKEKLSNKIEILINSMLNAKTDEEAAALQQMIYDLLEEAEDDFVRSQIDDAQTLKDEILNKDPNNELAIQMEKRLASLKKDLETQQEKAAFKKKLDQLLNETQKLLSENKFQEAEQLRKEILELDPENKIAKDLKETIVKLEKEKILKDKIDDLMERATKAFSNRKLESAEDLIQQILKLDPTNRAALDLKEKIAKKEKEILNESIDDLIDKTNSAIKKGQLEFAENLRQEIIKIDPNNPVVKELKEKISKRAEELKDKAEQDKKDTISKLVQQAKANLVKNNLLESEEQFNKVLLLDNNNIDALKGLADISIVNSQNDPSEIPRAIRKILKVLDYEPDNFEYLVSLSELYEKSQDYSNELNILQQILKIDPSAEFYVSAGIASYKITMFDDAETYFYMAMDLDPNYPEIYYPLALTFEKLENSDQREDMLKKGIELRPNHAATIYELGRYYTDEKRYQDALDLFLSALSLKEDSIKYQIGVAKGYLNLEEYDKSIEINENILKLDQTKSEVYGNLSIARFELGLYDQALTDISLAIKLKSDVPEYLYTIGQISEALGKDDYALTYYLTAIKLDNTYYKPMLNLGNIYDKFGNYENGLTILKLAYNINPDDPSVRASLGISYLHNEMYKESLILLEEAYNSDKGSALKLYNLSVAYTKVGESEKAENGYKRVLELDPGYFDAYYNLGQLLFTLDRKDEARTYFEKVLELNPDYKYKDKILEVL